MIINWEISVGNLVEMFVIVIGGFWTLFTIRGGVLETGKDVKRLERRTGLMEDSIEKIKEAMNQIAVQHERLNNQDARMNRLAQEIRDMKHGDGFVLPLPGPK